MAIKDYGSLQRAVAGYLHRTDLAAEIPGYIQLAEARLNRDLGLIGERCDRSVLLGAGERRLRLPADYNGFLSLWRGGGVAPPGDAPRRWADVTGTWSSPLAANPDLDTHAPPGRRLRYVGDQDLVLRDAPGEPRQFTILGVWLLFECPAELPLPLRLHYVRRFALSAREPTNSLLTSYPDVYLYATLLEVPVWDFDDERLVVYQDRYDRAVASINRHESSALGDDVMRSGWVGGSRFSMREG